MKVTCSGRVVVAAWPLGSIHLFCNPMDYNPPGSSVHGILQARILEWVAVPFSRGSSRPRDQTQLSCIAGRLFTMEPLGKPTPSCSFGFSALGKPVASPCLYYQGHVLAPWHSHCVIRDKLLTPLGLDFTICEMGE